MAFFEGLIDGCDGVGVEDKRSWTFVSNRLSSGFCAMEAELDRPGRGGFFRIGGVGFRSAVSVVSIVHADLNIGVGFGKSAFGLGSDAWGRCAVFPDVVALVVAPHPDPEA